LSALLIDNRSGISACSSEALRDIAQVGGRMARWSEWDPSVRSSSGGARL